MTNAGEMAASGATMADNGNQDGGGGTASTISK